jgi:hypothetical protein
MKKKFHIKRNFNSGIVMPGLFLFYILTAANGAPVIMYTVSESAGYINMSIMAFSLEPFKKSTLKIKYASGTDIANASVATSVASLSVGASIDKFNSILDITIFQTKKTGIDNVVLISLKVPSVTLVASPDLTVLEAQFTDYNGGMFNVPVSGDVKVRHLYSIPEQSHTVRYGYYLLSGKKVAGTFAFKRELPRQRCDMNMRIIQKVDIHE